MDKKTLKLINVWNGMLQRCINKNNDSYYLYGGRGIKVCDRWSEFKYFLEDMGYPPFQGASIDRIDNNGNYCKENCRWADAKTQANNKRPNSRQIFINYKNETYSLPRLSEILNISYTFLHVKLKKGYDINNIIEQYKSRKTSKHKGIYYSKSRNRWMVEIYKNKERILTKSFLTEDEAFCFLNSNRYENQ